VNGCVVAYVDRSFRDNAGDIFNAFPNYLLYAEIAPAIKELPFPTQELPSWGKLVFKPLY
jgi:hypothetical protein